MNSGRCRALHCVLEFCRYFVLHTCLCAHARKRGGGRPDYFLNSERGDEWPTGRTSSGFLCFYLLPYSHSTECWLTWEGVRKCFLQDKVVIIRRGLMPGAKAQCRKELVYFGRTHGSYLSDKGGAMVRGAAHMLYCTVMRKRSRSKSLCAVEGKIATRQ